MLIHVGNQATERPIDRRSAIFRGCKTPCTFVKKQRSPYPTHYTYGCDNSSAVRTYTCATPRKNSVVIMPHAFTTPARNCSRSRPRASCCSSANYVRSALAAITHRDRGRFDACVYIHVPGRGLFQEFAAVAARSTGPTRPHINR